MSKSISAYQKRYLIIADFQSYGGTKTYFMTLIAFLLRKKIRLTAYLYNTQVLTLAERNDLLASGVRLCYLPGFMRIKSRIIVRLRFDKFMQMIFMTGYSLTRYDKVIVSTGNPFNFLSGGLFSGSRLIYIIHSYPFHKLSFVSRFIDCKFYNFVCRIKRKSLNLVVVSEYSKTMVKEHFKKIGVRYEPEIDVISNTASQLGFVSDQEYPDLVLTVGHVVGYKNPAFWIEVAKYVVQRNSQVRFEWIGDGDLIEKMISKVPSEYSSKITFTGYSDKAFSKIGSSGVYFQPSLIESQGISVIDAMAQAIPCVVSNRGGLPELVLDGITGFVVDLNVTEAGNKILYLLQNKEISRQMGSAGYEKFIAEHSLKIFEEKMDNLIFKQSN